VDLTKAALLREMLTGTEFATRTAQFAHSLRRFTTRPSGLMVFGPADDEPWHLTAHLDDELHRAGFEDMRPSLIRWSPPIDAPDHLRIGLDRLRDVGRGESLLVVSETDPAASLLERVDDVRRRGATVFSIDGGIDGGDSELATLSHETLVPESLVTDLAIANGGFETAQHLVSLAVADDNSSPSGWRARLRAFIARVGDDGSD
jgi:hypothetical protein